MACSRRQTAADESEACTDLVLEVVVLDDGQLVSPVALARLVDAPVEARLQQRQHRRLARLVLAALTAVAPVKQIVHRSLTSSSNKRL